MLNLNNYIRASQIIIFLKLFKEIRFNNHNNNNKNNFKNKQNNN